MSSITETICWYDDDNWGDAGGAALLHDVHPEDQSLTPVKFRLNSDTSNAWLWSKQNKTKQKKPCFSAAQSNQKA